MTRKQYRRRLNIVTDAFMRGTIDETSLASILHNVRQVVYTQTELDIQLRSLRSATRSHRYVDMAR